MMAAAWHEAGHVVVAAHFGFTVTDMAVDVDKDCGSFSFRYDTDRDGDDLPFRKAVIYMAGKASEERAGFFEDCSTADARDAADLVGNTRLDDALAEARRVLADPEEWERVRRLAQAIMEPERESNIAGVHELRPDRILALLSGGAR